MSSVMKFSNMKEKKSIKNQRNFKYDRSRIKIPEEWYTCLIFPLFKKGTK